MRKIEYEFKFVGSCPVCAAHYQARNITLVSRKANLSHIHAQCASCKSSAMMFVVRNAAGFVTTIGMSTDMNIDDMRKFRSAAPITSDDVIELHKLLGND